MSSRVCLQKVTTNLKLAGQRLDKTLTQLLPEFSRARIQALIKQGLVARGDKVVKDASAKVKEDEVYTIHMPPPEPAVPAAQKIPLKIVYEDDDLLVIDKPVGMVVHPAPGHHDATLVNALLAHCGKSLSGIGGVARPGIVHRLDRDTSGLMVVAKNDAAHQALSRQFADRTLSRTYHALIWGTPAPRAGIIEAPVGRSPRDRKKMAVTAKGKKAVTHYKVLESFAQVSLVECRLATGRTHQIRVHFSHQKHPVVGDPTYGKRKMGKDMPKILQDFPRQALHAVELRFLHPRSGILMQFQSNPPRDIMNLLRQLRRMGG